MVKKRFVDVPFCLGYFFFRIFNFCWTLGLFMLRFEFRSRTFFVVLFILFIESLSHFVFNCLFVLISRIKLYFVSKMLFRVMLCRVKYCFVLNILGCFVFSLLFHINLCFVLIFVSIIVVSYLIFVSYSIMSCRNYLSLLIIFVVFKYCSWF